MKDDEKNLQEVYGCDIKNNETDFTVIDDIHRDNRKRINQRLNELSHIIMRNAVSLSFNQPELHKIVHEKQTNDIKDLNYLLQQSKQREKLIDEKK
jgi:hypothetical protein